MSTLRITQVRSANGASPGHLGSLRSLGLGRIGKTTERPDEPHVRGMIRSVAHLLKVEEAGK